MTRKKTLKKNILKFAVGLLMAILCLCCINAVQASAAPAMAADSGVCTLIAKLGDVLDYIRLFAFVGAGADAIMMHSRNHPFTEHYI